MDTLTELRIRYMGAVTCYRDLVDMGASDTVLAQQIARCRALRAAMNQECPDSEWYDVNDGNIVEQPV